MSAGTTTSSAGNALLHKQAPLLTWGSAAGGEVLAG